MYHLTGSEVAGQPVEMLPRKAINICIEHYLAYSLHLAFYITVCIFGVLCLNLQIKCVLNVH